MATLPGTGRLAPASSITSTQSFELGGVKLRIPELGSVLIKLAVPLDGLNHQHFAVARAGNLAHIHQDARPSAVGNIRDNGLAVGGTRVTVADSPEP